MVWLLDGEKNFEDMFIRFDRIHECDRRTAHDSINRTYAQHRAAKLVAKVVWTCAGGLSGTDKVFGEASCSTSFLIILTTQRC